jgi:hypothetical protein
MMHPDTIYEGHPPDLTPDELVTVLFFRNGVSVPAIARVFQMERRQVESTLREHYASLRRAYNEATTPPLLPPQPLDLDSLGEVDF